MLSSPQCGRPGRRYPSGLSNDGDLGLKAEDDQLNLFRIEVRASLQHHLEDVAPRILYFALFDL
jgi:hypothetical protein